MHIFDKVMDQAQSMRLPMIAVTLTAVPRANTPVLLGMHWHGFAKPQTPRAMPTDAHPEKAVTVPSSALQVSEAWHALEHLDDAMLTAAWQFGAWDLVREERRGCNTAGATEKEALECKQAFAESPFDGSAEDCVLAEAPDRLALMQLGARIGYVRWQFRPVKNGLWQNTSSDDTLLSDGGRALPCPVVARPPVGVRTCQTRYHLGRSNRIVLL